MKKIFTGRKNHFIFSFLFMSVFFFCNSQNYNMGNGTITDCGGNFYDPGGSAGAYANSSNFTQTICSNNGQPVYIQFTSFQIESGFDNLTIYDGPTTASPVLGAWTGTNSPGSVQGTGTCITILFTSDASVTFFGWTAVIGCGVAPPPPPPPPQQYNTDCATMSNPFCTGTTYTFPNTTGVASYGGGGTFGCLGSTPNPVWYYMQMATSGNINIGINQTNTSGTPIDVDFCLWGPFTSVGAGCPILASSNIVSCSYSGSASETATIPSGVTGEVYILLLTNFSNQTGTITFSQSGGTGSTNCNILCNITSMTSVPGPCSSPANTFTSSGTLNTTAPPSSGTLTISSSCGGTPVVMNPPFATSINYTVTNIPATGGPCQITASYSADPTCTFTVNITSPAPCTACTATASNTGPYCPGNTIQLNSTGGGTYSWSGPGGFTSTLQNPAIAGATVAMSGAYTVTVTIGAATCTATTNVVVNSVPVPTASNTGPYCAGTTIQLNGGGGGTYSWTGPAFASGLQNPAIAGSTAAMSGIYTLTVTVGTCTASTTTNVVVNANPVPTATNTGPYCPGSVVQLNSSGGGTYSWTGPGGFVSAVQNPSPGAASAALAGVYTVTVSVGTCTATSSTTVVVNATLIPGIVSNSPICAGATLNLTCSNGVTWAWTGPNGFASAAQNPSIPLATVAASGVYSATVTDASGCTGTGTINVVVNPLPIVTVNSQTICAGITVNLTAGGATNYSWSAGTSSPTGANVTVTPAVTTNYIVTGTDGNGCVNTATSTITVNPIPVAAATNTGPYCPGTAVQLNSTGGGTYAWTGPNGFADLTQNPSPGAASASLAGVYTVTVTLATCTATASTTVIVNASLIPGIASNSPICSGATLNLTCTNGVTWNWTGPNGFSSTAQNPSIPSATTAESGTYNATVTDASGCTGTGSLTVFVNSPVILSVSSIDVTCGLTCDGQVSVIASGGTAGYSYSWTGGCASSSCTNLCSGTYNVVVTDAASCTATANAIVNQPVALNAVIASSASVTCNGLCNGSATAAVPAGTGSYTYSWNTVPAQTTAAAGALCAGTYVCTVNDTSCTPSGTELVPNGDFSSGNTGFSSSYTYTPPPNTLAGQYWVATGAQVSTWNGGMTSNGDHTTGSGDFMIVNGAGTPGSNVWCQTITVAPNTTYLFSTWVSSMNNASPAQLQFSINGVSVGAVFNAPASSGIWAQFFATWNSGANTSANICIVNQNTTLGGNDFGLDDISFEACTHACPNTVSVTISEPPVMSITAAGPAVVCNGSNINLSVAGGPVGTNYTWTPGNLNGANQTVVAANTTTFTVSGVDANGCSDTDSVAVTVPPNIVLATGGFPATCNGVCNGQVVVLANPTVGQFATYTYLWSNNAATPSVNGLCAGTYSVTVTDAAGCSDTASAVVTQPTPVTGASSAITPTSCNAICDGSVLITPNGGTAPYNYAWAPAAAGNNPNTLCAGNYVCTVSDANGCSVPVNVTIVEPAAISVSISPATPICIGQTANLVSNPLGGNGGYVYTWTGGTTPTNTQNVTATPIVTSIYNVSVTDANNCAPAVASVTVTVAPPLNVVASADDTICVGATQNISGTATGGDGTYTYTWSAGTTPAVGSGVSVTPAVTTTYIVTVTDGCGTPSASDSLIVTVNPLPVLGITTNIQSGCAPQCVDFTATFALCPPMSVVWNFNNGTNYTSAAGDSVAPNICFLNAGIYGGTITATDTNGCVNVFTNNSLVTVFPVPTADYTFSPQPTTELNPIIYFVDSSYGAPISSWLWNFNDPADSSSILQNPNFGFPGPGTFDVVLQVTSINGCIDTVFYPVIIDPDFVIFVPNAFSPNEDGTNEVFMPKGIGVNTDKYQMWVYDRWGNMIFTTTDWATGWDGKVQGHNNNQVVQEDVYVWKIKLHTYDGTQKSYVGHVTVVK